MHGLAMAPQVRNIASLQSSACTNIQELWLAENKIAKIEGLEALTQVGHTSLLLVLCDASCTTPDERKSALIMLCYLFSAPCA